MSGPPQQPRNADDLLKWSIAQSGAQDDATNDSKIQSVAADIAAGNRPDLTDPALYNALMGKSEAQMMREELGVALDASRTEQDRVQALDNFEMLVEQIDNANNMTNMKMWAPVLGLLSDDGGSTAQGSTSPKIQLAALWILGTAVQNNDKAQMAILDHDALRPILHLLAHGTDGQVRSKAMYALSGILKHNPKAVDLFTQQGGWVALRGALLDPDISLRRKAAFLVNSLLLQDDSPSRQQPVPSSSSIFDTPRSTSTALAPMPQSNGTRPADGRPPMPLEQPPATLRSGVPHPAVPPQLLTSELLLTLIVSLLPASVHSTLPAGLDTAAPAGGGPDGDIELRDDLDYAEKGVRACLTFVDKVCNDIVGGSKTSVAAVAWGETEKSLREQARTLLHLLAKDLRGPPVEASDGISSRWQELSLGEDEVDAFDAGIQTI